MKAIRVESFGEPSVLRVADLDLPSPQAGEVLVEVRAAGINPVDTYIRSGAYAKKPTLPYTPGTDGAGVVLEVGEGVVDFAAGDRVFVSGSITGTSAEQALCLASDVHPLPVGVTFAQGAALGVPYATAFRALFQRGRVVEGETVLIHGASGGVGTAAVQLAHGAGLRVFGTASTEAGRKLVKELGADDVFNHREGGYLEAIGAATDGRGVDCIIEMLANVNVAPDLTLLAPHGRIVVVGNRGVAEVNLREAMQRDADIRGMMLGNATTAERADIYAALVGHLRAGEIVPVIAQEFALADAPAAHEAVMADKAPGKIVLIP